MEMKFHIFQISTLYGVSGDSHTPLTFKGHIYIKEGLADATAILDAVTKQILFRDPARNIWTHTT
jgi:hypothetical protein